MVSLSENFLAHTFIAHRQLAQKHVSHLLTVLHTLVQRLLRYLHACAEWTHTRHTMWICTLVEFLYEYTCSSAEIWKWLRNLQTSTYNTATLRTVVYRTCTKQNSSEESKPKQMIIPFYCENMASLFFQLLVSGWCNNKACLCVCSAMKIIILVGSIKTDNLMFISTCHSQSIWKCFSFSSQYRYTWSPNMFSQ